MKFTVNFLVLLFGAQAMKIQKTHLIQKKAIGGASPTLLQAFQEHKEHTHQKIQKKQSPPAVSQYVQEGHCPETIVLEAEAVNDFNSHCPCGCDERAVGCTCGYPYGPKYCDQPMPCTDPNDPYCDTYDDPYDNPYMDPYDTLNYVLPKDDPYRFDPYIDPCDPENYADPYFDPDGEKFKHAKCKNDEIEPWSIDDDFDEHDGDYPDPYQCPCEETGSDPYDNDYDPFQHETDNGDDDPYGPDEVVQLEDIHYDSNSADSDALFLSTES